MRNIIVLLLLYAVRLPAANLTFRANDADLRTVLNRIDRLTGTKVLVHKDAHGTVSVDFKDASVQQALAGIVEVTGGQTKWIHDLEKTVVFLPWFYHIVACGSCVFEYALTNIQPSIAVPEVHYQMEKVLGRSLNVGDSLDLVLEPEEAKGAVRVIAYGGNRFVADVVSSFRALDLKREDVAPRTGYSIDASELSLLPLALELSERLGLTLVQCFDAKVNIRLRGESFLNALNAIVGSVGGDLMIWEGSPPAVWVRSKEARLKYGKTIAVHRFTVSEPEIESCSRRLRSALRRWRQLQTFDDIVDAQVSPSDDGNGVVVMAVGDNVRVLMAMVNLLVSSQRE